MFIRCFALITATFFTSITEFPQRALANESVVGDVTLLKSVADNLSANQSKLLTWIGQARVKDTAKLGTSSGFCLSHASFWWDKTNNKLRTSWKIIQRCGDQRLFGGVHADVNVNFTEGLIGNGRATVLKRGLLPVSIVIRNTIGADGGPASFVLIPANYFGVNGTDIGSLFLSIYQQRDAATANPWKVKRVGNLIICRIERENTINEYAMNLAEGGTPSYIRMSGPSEKVSPSDYNELKTQWTHQRVDGVWLPKTYHFEHRNIIDGANAVRTRSVEWVESDVNVPILRQRFSIDDLGIQNGESIEDHTGPSVSTERYSKVEGPTKE